jgi:hypothetical protein
MKVRDLEGAELDYWVAKAEGATPTIEEWPDGPICIAKIRSFERVPFRPSSVWSDGGPIIDRERIYLFPEDGWTASTRFDCGSGEGAYGADVWENKQAGPTPLIAAMRAFVASRFGEDVDNTPAAVASDSR